MISGKIILKSATKLSLDKRFSEIAKQTPTIPIRQQTNVIIPSSKQDLFRNKRPNTLSIAQRLKKRSINNRLGRNTNSISQRKPRVFQRLSLGNNTRRRTGGNSYLFGGQSGMGVRLRGPGRIGGPRTFRNRNRSYLNNNNTRPNRNKNNNQGQRNGTKNNFNRNNHGRGKRNFSNNRPARNQNNRRQISKESLDTDLDQYMSQTKLENDSVDMNAV